ncbi:pentapeptide repeat-containing protein [Metaclostridioides mangenotii]|uniref:pentapeptide repeat-containing protein n=1 Tax=Metaclostridioides mangenotii TaxID=1540 RepID=UPI0028E54C61|nr:pentapeptide repeat-containing protein [Clostridioides mangenotii]
MRCMKQQDLIEILDKRGEKSIDLSMTSFDNMDLQGFDFHNIDLSKSSFKNSNLSGANFRNCNLTEVNIEGANIFGSNLEGALLEGIVFNDNTKYYKMSCPEEGAFIGWKKCFNFRVVQLLIPADAKRCSATYNACRCDKAKVLSIKSIDYKESFDEAISYADGNFKYRVGKMAIPSGFNDDRWSDSTEGIHFFMTREEAIAYL